MYFYSFYQALVIFGEINTKVVCSNCSGYYLVVLALIKANSPCYSHSTRLLAASTLRTVLGTRNLAEILSERETISHTMQTSLDEATDPWGVKVERVEM